jgi:hypothetical protein
MFGTIIERGFMDIALKKSEAIIQADRDRFKDVVICIREFLEKEDIIVSDTNTLCGITTLAVSPIIAYVDSPKQSSYNLGKKLLAITPYIRLSTKIFGKSYSVDVDSREFIRFDLMETYKGKLLKAYFKPIKLGKLFYLPPELEIIDIYKRLHNPKYESDYEQLRKKEQVLYPEFVNRMTKIIGGGNKCSTCKNKIDGVAASLRKTLFYNFFDDVAHEADFCFIGNTATDLVQQKLDFSEKLNVISKYSSEETVSMIIDFVSKHTNLKLGFKNHNTHLPNDLTTENYTVHVEFNVGGKMAEKILVSIFNNASFELIPFYVADIGDRKYRLPIKTVQLRFMAMEIWLYNIIAGASEDASFDKVFNKLKKIISSVEFVSKNFTDDFTEYIGVYEDLEIKYKRMVISDRRNFPVYPATFKF